MPARMVALLFDELLRRDLDLVRALYDRASVDHVPPHVPLVAPFEEATSLADLREWIGVHVTMTPPFMLELGDPQRTFDGERHLLQVVARRGAGEAQRLAGALYRDVFPHQRKYAVGLLPDARTALTLGRFDTQAAADRAVAELGDKAYFAVVTTVAILEKTAASDDAGEHGAASAWTVLKTLDLGAMLLPGP